MVVGIGVGVGPDSPRGREGGGIGREGVVSLNSSLNKIIMCAQSMPGPGGRAGRGPGTQRHKGCMESSGSLCASDGLLRMVAAVDRLLGEHRSAAQ